MTAFNGVVFNNSGVVEVLTGTLRLAGYSDRGIASGSFNGAAGTTLEFYSGTYTLDANSSINFPRIICTTVSMIINGGFLGWNPGSVVTVTGGAVLSTSVPLTMTSLTLGGSTLSGAGNIVVSNAITVTGESAMNGPGKTISNGKLTVADATYLTLDGREIVNKGTGSLGNGIGVVAWNAAILRNTASGTLDLRGAGSMVFCKYNPTSNWCSHPGQPVFVNEGTVIHSGNGTFMLLSDPSFWTIRNFGPVRFVNSGTLDVQAGAMWFKGFTQSAGATQLSGGRILSLESLDIQGGTLSGTGIITGTVTNSGALHVGGIGAAGVLTITDAWLVTSPPDPPAYVAGSYVQTVTGTLGIELGGLSPGTQHDQLRVNGSATLDGILDVSTINGYVPGSGASFQVLTYTTHSGIFATINGHGPTYSPAYNSNNLTLSVSSLRKKNHEPQIYDFRFRRWGALLR